MKKLLKILLGCSLTLLLTVGSASAWTSGYGDGSYVSGSASSTYNGTTVTNVVRTTPGFNYQTHVGPCVSSFSGVKITTNPNFKGSIVRSISSIKIRSIMQDAEKP